MTRVVAFSGSARIGSLNVGLLTAAATQIRAKGADVDVVDLVGFALPIYDGDLQANHGLPVAAIALHDRIAAADGVLIASPEYNGGPSPLLKNAIDWVSRADMTVFAPRPIGLMAATPGRRGGVHGLDVMTRIFTWMRCQVHEPPFSLPTAHESMVEGELIEEESIRLSEWIDGYLDVVAAAIDAD